jgi:hypothetical protein
VKEANPTDFVRSMTWRDAGCPRIEVFNELG